MSHLHHLRRSAALASSLVLALALSACGGDEPAEDEPAPTATETTTSPEDAATAAYQDYWDVYVQTANSGLVESGVFQGVAEGAFVERDLKLLGDQADAGVVRVGEPSFSDYATTVKGATATSLVCIDESGWGLRKDGEDLPAPEGATPSPFQATLAERDGAWIVTDLVFQEGTPCP